MTSATTAAATLLKLDQSTRIYAPGDVLSGEYCLDSLAGQGVWAVELSVLWYTEGKGDEDLAVHYFDRLQPQGSRVVELREPRRFSTRLPNSPLTYLGLIVQIRWCVRIRVFLASGKDIFVEEPFQLGNIPAPKLPEPAAASSTLDAAKNSAVSKTLPLKSDAAAANAKNAPHAAPS
jgi:hypothetical protein